MIKTLLLFFLMTTSVFAQRDSLEVLCINFHGDQIDMLKVRDAGCKADLVWGFDKVCFKGDAQDFADYLNEDFSDDSPGLITADAEVSDSGSVVFTGVDQQNFYSKTSELHQCE